MPAERSGSAPPSLLLHSDRPDKFEPAIRARFPHLALSCCRTYAELAAAVDAARPSIVLSHKFESRPYPGRVLVDADCVRWIHVGGTGVDHFRPWARERLTITNSAGAPRLAIAEYVMGAIYALNLHLADCLRSQVERKWVPRSIRVAAGGTVTVIGLGRIGRAICAKAKAAGLNVLGVRRLDEPVPEVDELFSPERMNVALARADYVVVAVPLTEATRGLLDSDAIAAIKPGALLVNVARGGIVNEPALIEALHTGHIRGAVLDVFQTEPLPAESPFWSLHNVIVTPHMAGFFDGWEDAALDIFLQNLERWVAGRRPLVNEIDPDVGY